MDRLLALQDEGKLAVTLLTEEQREPIKEAFINATEEMVVENCGQEILGLFRGN